MKNHADRLIFHLAVCTEAQTALRADAELYRTLHAAIECAGWIFCITCLSTGASAWRIRMTALIDGKKISAQIKDEVKEEIAALNQKGIQCTLAVIQVGDDPASTIYVRNKQRACEYTGIHSEMIRLSAQTTQEELIAKVGELNEDPSVNGILVQLPLPKGLDEDAVIRAISPDKDVDGFHPMNVGRLSIGLPGFVSCTPAGIIQLLKRSGVDIDGKECVIVGRSNIVGKPMGILMLRENATVTIAHSHTKNLKEVTLSLIHI